MYYTAALSNYISVLNNTFHARSPMTRREKIAYNNRILQKKTFQDALQKGKLPISGALRKAYQSEDYARVLAVECMQDFKRSVLRLLGK